MSTAADRAQLRTVKARAQWEGRYRNALYVRQFPAFYIAEPEKLGGDDSAPTPMETVLAAYNGCLAVVVELVAQEQGIPLDALEISSEGTIDRRGLLGSPGVPAHFQSVTVNIRLQSPASHALLELLQDEVARRSPAHNLLVDAGVPVRINWELVRP